MTTTATSTERTSLMGATLAVRPAGSHLRNGLSRKVRVARALECSEALADKKLYGPHAIHVETAKVVASDLEAQDYESIARTMAPIDAALAGQTVAPLPDAQFTYDCADADEDLAQAAWVREHTDKALEEYRVKVANELNAGARLLGCIMLEQRKRREAK